MKTGIGLTLAALLFVSSAGAQEKAAPPSPGSMAEECMKHCRQMSDARQKAAEAHKARMEKMDATFKEVRAQLETAKSARGEKKVAALEAALEKLVSFHESMRDQMDAMPQMGPGMMMGGHPMMMGMGSCCPGMAMMSDCPMMKGETPSKN
jgi:Flp pilus assembly protein TadD